jgi:hypothetical protein
MLKSGKEKRVVQGKRAKIDEIVRCTSRKFLVKFDTVIRSLSEARG